MGKVWTSQPDYAVPVDAKWLSRGLKCFHVLNASLWNINLVTGKQTGSIVGSGHTFNGDKIRSSGAVGGYINLSLDGYSAVAPFTVIIGCKHISGSVDWSILRRDAGAGGKWYGMYSVSGPSIRTSDSNSFDGTIAPTSGGGSGPFPTQVATALVGTNNLRGSVGGGAIAVDTTVSNPTGGNLLNIALGASKRDLVDNEAIADFTYFGIFDGALSDDELASLSRNPYQILQAPAQDYFAGFSAATIIALGAASLTFVPKTIRNALAARLAASTLTFVPKAVQPGLAARLAAAVLTFVPKAPQLSVTARLAAGALTFAAKAITYGNTSLGTVIDLGAASLSFVAKATQSALRNNLSAASLTLSGMSIQNKYVQNLAKALLKFTAQPTNNLIALSLGVASLRFVARAITVTGSVVGAVKQFMTLMGFGK